MSHTDREIKRYHNLLVLLQDLFQDNSIGLTPHTNSNGADWYTCPSCYNSKDIKGHQWGPEHITGMDHDPECKLMELYNLI